MDHYTQNLITKISFSLIKEKVLFCISNWCHYPQWLSHFVYNKCTQFCINKSFYHQRWLRVRDSGREIWSGNVIEFGNRVREPGPVFTENMKSLCYLSSRHLQVSSVMQLQLEKNLVIYGRLSLLKSISVIIKAQSSFEMLSYSI